MNAKAEAKKTQASEVAKEDTKQNAVVEAKQPETKAETKPEVTQAAPQAVPQDSVNPRKGAAVNTMQGMNSPELREMRDWINSVLKEREQAEIKEAREQILKIAQAVGVPLADLVNFKGKPTQGNLPHVPAPAKYKHPQTGATWSGRGRQPQWVASWISEHGNEEGIKL